MDARVKAADTPHGRKPGYSLEKGDKDERTDDESEAVNPAGNIAPVTENVLRRIPLIGRSRSWQRSEGGNNNREIGNDKDILQTSQDSCDRTS